MCMGVIACMCVFKSSHMRHSIFLAILMASAQWSAAAQKPAISFALRGALWYQGEHHRPPHLAQPPRTAGTDSRSIPLKLKAFGFAVIQVART